MALEVRTFPGAPDGMGRYVPQHELSDTECYTLFDAILDVPGLIRRRGPLDITGSANAGYHMLGIARAQAPDGEERVIGLERKVSDGSARLKGISNSSLTDASWPARWGALSQSAVTAGDIPSQELFDSKDALGGGAFIGSSDAYSGGDHQLLALWRGGSSSNPSKNLAASVSRGDLTVTLTAGSGTGFQAGTWVFDQLGTKLIGCVKSVSGDVLTLEHPALASETVQVFLPSFRGVTIRVSKGRITTTSSSTTVNGGLTKFLAQGMDSGTWDIFKPDYTYIGTVSSVSSDSQLTLTSNAVEDLLNADYIAIQRDAVYSMSRATATLGWINASFGGHQFYANANKVRFSDRTDPEAVDVTPNGDELEFSSDPVRALIPTESALVTVTEKEAYALTGAIGTTPDQWRGERIHDDGTICGMGATTYKGGAIWPGKRGIWYWNGADPINLAGKLGNDYQKFVTGVDRCWGMVCQDHYFLFVEGGVTGVFSKTKNATDGPYTSLTICINLGTGATSLLTNVAIRGAVRLPDSIGLGTALYGVTLDDDSSAVALADSLFLDDATDDDTCINDTAGPDFYLESKKYDMGDPQRKKLVKMLLLWYRSVAGNLKIDSVPGLETAGTLVTTQFLESSTYTDKRSKFMSSTQLFAFRLYQSDTRANGSPAITTRITLGPWAIAFKFKRPGRV